MLARTIRTVCAALAILLASAGTALAAAGGCHTYSGDFTAVAPADCDSPFGICTHGTLVGDFPSTYDFSVDTLDAFGNYTGHSTITSEQGALIFGSDSGTLVPQPDGTATFVTTVQIVGGTRQYAHATGTFVAPGTLDLATGNTVGTYSATVCLGVGSD
jgi:hypothetical protein